MPKYWLIVSIVPTFKKGDPESPASYSLLSVVGKIDARYLYNELLSCTTSCRIFGTEQTGFRQGESTMENCLILSHIIHKQVTVSRSRLYVAFMGIFDSVDWKLLWTNYDGDRLDSY